MATSAALRSALTIDPNTHSFSMAQMQSSPWRTCEVAALHPDGQRSLSTFRTPCLPIFEEAFSAFARGTVLTTPHGPVAIEDLQPGDWLTTVAGKPAQVMWIGASSYVPAGTGSTIPLTRIMADSFGPQRPVSFVTAGPAARLLHTPAHLRKNNISAPLLTAARAFVDSVNVIAVTPPTPVKLFHICLARHAAVDVGGVEMETYHPGPNISRQLTPAQRDLFLSMFPHIVHLSDFGPLSYTRADDVEMVA